MTFAVVPPTDPGIWDATTRFSWAGTSLDSKLWMGDPCRRISAENDKNPLLQSRGDFCNNTARYMKRTVVDGIIAALRTHIDFFWGPTGPSRIVLNCLCWPQKTAHMQVSESVETIILFF